MNVVRDILVIDDEPMVTQAVVKVCSAEGMTVTAADHASEALRCLEESKFRLALCDIMMQGLDGFQFLDELARRGIQMPVVMMTGYSTVENAVKSLTSTGAVDYISKPFTADELLTVIRRSLRCVMLLDEAESAGLPRKNSMSYVPCPADYYRLGYVSWVLMEGEGRESRARSRHPWTDRRTTSCARWVEKSLRSMRKRNRPLHWSRKIPISEGGCIESCRQIRRAICSG